MWFTTCFTFVRRWVLLYSGVNFIIWKFYSLLSLLQDIVKVETSDDEPVVPVSIHNISVVDELWSCIIWIIDDHNMLELLMLHNCIEKEALVRIGFFQLYFFFLPHVGNGSNYPSLFYHFCGLCNPSFVQWNTFAWVFVPQGKQLTSYSYPSFLVVHMKLIAWMRLRAGVEWALLTWIASCCWML